MLAKICTDMNKPNGQTYLPPNTEGIMDFMKNLSVRKIPGIGRMTELILGSLGIYNCADVLEKAVEIFLSFSEKTSSFLFRAALGISRNHHEEDDEDACQKSISVSSTFRPLVTLEQFRDKISELSEELSERIDKRKVAGITVTLELKSVKFEVVQKSMTVKSYIWLAEDIARYCHQILDTIWPYDKVRLIGVKLSNLRN
jgi:DNA polymerase kappa